MRICTNCSAPLKDDDMFCKKCGQKAVLGKLSLDESIYLASDLEKKYSERDRLKKELSDLEQESRRYKLPAKRPRYSAFRFFWPFLIYSQFAVFVVCIIFIGILFGGGFGKMSTDAVKLELYLFGFIAEGATLIVGGVYASRKRDKLNQKLIEDEDVIFHKQRDIEAKIIELKGLLRTLEYGLKDFDRRVPIFLRNEKGMIKVRKLLEGGQAEDFDQAVIMCV